MRFRGVVPIRTQGKHRNRRRDDRIALAPASEALTVRFPDRNTHDAVHQCGSFQPESCYSARIVLNDRLFPFHDSHCRLRLMNHNEVAVFFYGLFMDESLLASRGIHPSQSTVGYVDGYRLRIGKRATLVPKRASRAYGVLMTIQNQDATTLYSDESVSDYIPEPVSVTLPSGVSEPAICYNLPSDRLEGTNSAYAEALLQLATNLGFPAEYLDAIRMQGRPK